MSRTKFINKSEMLKALTFMKQVADGLQVEGDSDTAHVYRSSLNVIIAYSGRVDFIFDGVSPEWLKGFEVYLRNRGCGWNTVSTYLCTFRAVHNRAVDPRKASYVSRLLRSVHIGIRADHKCALGDEDMKKVFAKLSRTSGAPLAVYQVQELFILMFSLRGMPFADLVYLCKSDLRDNVITYRRRKTGQPLSVTLTPEVTILVKKYMNRDPFSPYLSPLLKSREGTKEAYREYQLALYSFNQQLVSLGELSGLSDKLSSYTVRRIWATTVYYCEIHSGTISKAVGHSFITVAETYLKPLRSKKIGGANKQVPDSVKRPVVGVSV